jgi:Spondin_N/FlgD Ig-like domain
MTQILRSDARAHARAAVVFVLTACAFVMATASAAPAQTAHYVATFDATWTVATHPINYPPSPHFSGLVGGTHDATVAFWQEGTLASLGFQHMAEWGSQIDLLAEVQTAIDDNQAEFTISDAPLWTVPGATSVEFAANPEFSLVTLVAMIGPSPDWFVGVNGLELMPGGMWADEIVVDLYAYDSGTDSGVNYTSGDIATVPAVPISAITDGPLGDGVPLGTLTFTKLYVSDVPLASGFQASAFPNPFNPQTTIAWELPNGGPMALEIFDIKGRKIRTLRDGAAAAGSGQAVWDGRTDSGRRVTSGQYFYRIRAGGHQLNGRLTLIK